MKFKDHLGDEVELASYPKRIVSLVPSQTELLCDLGLENEVVGITRFCIHPTKWRSEKMVIGGTKNFDFETIQKLQPDLIIGNKEENYQEGIEKLKNLYPVWMSDIVSFEDALKTIADIGSICNRSENAHSIIQEIEMQRSAHQHSILKGKKAAYFIWKNPYMVAASNTFINSMMQVLGINNVFHQFERYPEFTLQQLQEFHPDLVFLSSEPYSFNEKHLAEFKNIFPSANICLVDGEMFSWYGSRLRLAFNYFKTLEKKMC
jgi:ABC-type Fe3+-hydroxamate transport system substrate-binding protein